MRDAFSLLVKLGLLATVLAVVMLAWDGGAEAGTAGRHMGGIHATQPCHDEAAATTNMAADTATDRDGCPENGCAATGCAHVAAILPATPLRAIAYDAQPLPLRPAVRLSSQADTGPPAKPPRS